MSVRREARYLHRWGVVTVSWQQDDSHEWPYFALLGWVAVLLWWEGATS